MDQDGNTAMPQSSSFSSSNFQPDDNSKPSAGATDANVAAAAAAMTDADPKQAITSSAPTATSSHMFGRRFKQNAASSNASTFNNAPDFFKQAASQNSDYITIGEQPPKPASKKKVIIIVAVVILAFAAVAVAFVPELLKTSVASGEKRQLHSAWAEMGCEIVFKQKECDIAGADETVILNRTVIPDGEGKNNYSTYYTAVDTFLKKAEKVGDSDYKKEIISNATLIRGRIEGIEKINNFLMTNDNLIIDAVISRLYEDSTNLDDIIYSSFSKDYTVALVQRAITDYATDRYKELNYLYENGCNTADSLVGSACKKTIALPEDIKEAAKSANSRNVRIIKMRHDYNRQMNQEIIDGLKILAETNNEK